jgi:hypothetical protein
MNNKKSITLGKRVAYSDELFIDEDQRARHIYAIGKTGSGKTTLLRSLALQDIYTGRGLCVIDPHGDNAKILANSIPSHRIKDTIYFDASDRDHVIGINPLSFNGSVDDAELVASEIIVMFKSLFRDSWGEWLEYLLKNVLLTVLNQPNNEPVTLLSVLRMLDDKEYRERLVSKVKDPVIKRFWVNFFERLKEKDELDRISSTLNKIGKFALSPVLRNVFSQTKTNFDIKRAMDNKQIVIINLAKGRIGADNANFLGSAIMSKIVSTALRRSAIPESERVPFYLNIDEFQNFTTDEFTTIVSEARKYALSLLIAHQNLDQINPRVVNQIIKDSGALIAFKVGFGDDRRLSDAFHPLHMEELSTTDDGEFYARVGSVRPHLVRGYSPQNLDDFQTGSLNKVIKLSRWRYGRPRKKIERDFERWYKYNPAVAKWWDKPEPGVIKRTPEDYMKASAFQKGYKTPTKSGNTSSPDLNKINKFKGNYRYLGPMDKKYKR